MALNKEQLYEALVESDGVSEEAFNKAAASRDVQKQGIDGVLVSRGELTDQQAGQLIADYYKTPFVDVDRSDVTEKVLQLIPESFARKQRVIPIGRDGETTSVAISEPTNVVLTALLEKYLRGRVKFYYATSRDIESNFYLYQKDPKTALEKIITGSGEDADTKVVRFVDSLIDYAFQNKASDIHVEPEEDYVIIRYRIDGILHDIYEMPKKFQEAVITRLKVVARLAIDEHRAAQDGKISHKSQWGDRVEIRISVVPTTNGEKAVMRLLSEKARQFSLSDLGLGEEDYAKFRDAIKRPWGKILVTGPTGSGKTTTLYAGLKVLNKRSVNIATIEDPVEYDIEGVNQIQVNARTNLTFAKGLRSIVRQDPDIIMVGEIRDAETADIAVNAALTGHLVLSTMHTNDASTAFPRLKDMGVEPFLISSTVVVVIAQRLIRKICLECIYSYELEGKELKHLKKHETMIAYLQDLTGKKNLKGMRLFKGKGCQMCSQTGYSGRTGIFEVLVVTDELRESVMQAKTADKIRDIAIEQGMTTMLYDGLRKVTLGITTLEEVTRATQE